MKKILDCITDITYDSNVVVIECTYHKIQVPIVDGTVQINIIDLDNNKIGINNIKKNDSIKIFYHDKINDMIKPIKIIKINNYIFNDDSSSSSSLSDDILF